MDWLWFGVTAVCLWVCTVVPMKIYAADERKRSLVNWLILIPVSLVIILYVYPVGIELFRKLAVNH